MSSQWAKCLRRKCHSSLKEIHSFVKELKSGHDKMCNIYLLNIWPLTVTLTLSWHIGNMGSAHPLVEVNVSFKFEGNPSISRGVKKRTQIGDRRTDRPTDGTKRIQYSPPPHILWWGYNETILPIYTLLGKNAQFGNWNLPDWQTQYCNNSVNCVCIWLTAKCMMNVECISYAHFLRSLVEPGALL